MPLGPHYLLPYFFRSPLPLPPLAMFDDDGCSLSQRSLPSFADKVYDLLKSQGVPHPENVYASRDGYSGQKLEELEIVEADDYIQVNVMAGRAPEPRLLLCSLNRAGYVYVLRTAFSAPEQEAPRDSSRRLASPNTPHPSLKIL